eukprot:CAMPEP_0116880736 /NCGR_PEP_ID=MMETSP0463-20121206/12707_1 /TAXON_ID=181622 /ORGANISM="Strombidinopsis sp, Strain SopsisLIS2011" /LENGTH=73 /DNA_ID=CAMNT_0004531697 /DNA_START=2579 /DNA_END=2800 /DNA_ORIENTATION=-
MLEINQATGLMAMTFALIFIIFMELMFKSLLQRMGFSMSSTDIEVDENLPNFYLAVKLSDADWIVYENRNMRD